MPRAPSLTFFCGLAVIVAIAASHPTGAQEAATPTVDEIVAEANRVAYYQGADGSARVTMKIIDSGGGERVKEFTILRRDDPPPEGATGEAEDYAGDQRFYVYFHLPADEHRKAFLVWKHIEGDDDRWLYLPALDLIKRIASTEKRTSFVGSHFFYEDVSGRSIKDDNHQLVETTENYYVLRGTPKDPESVEFAYYKMWIHRGSFVTVRVQYFNATDELYREYSAEKVETIQGFPTVTQAKMRDVARNAETIVTYRDVKYDVGLPAEIFSDAERYLRNAPRRYLR